MNSKETIREKARCELHKEATCHFEHILEASPNKTTAVRPLASYHTNHLSKINQMCWALLEKKEQTHKRHSSIDEHTSVGRPAKTYISQLCVDHWMPSRRLTKNDAQQGQMV